MVPPSRGEQRVSGREHAIAMTRLNVNGRLVAVNADPDTPLLWASGTMSA